MRTVVRRLNPPRLDERGVVHTNNWGRGGGVNTPTAAFLGKELPAAAALGVSVYQINAGWHVGDARALGVEKLEPRSTSEVNPDFWAVNPARFPDGPKPIRDLAASLGVEIGLWYCLDRADGYANWRQDLGTMLGLHNRFGCVHFKLDGLSLDSRAAERNLTALDERTAGRVAVSIDITAGQSRRLGLFHGLAHVRDHFVGDRYTGSGTYWPHRALRNLWQLVHLVPTDRLEIEWLNTARHPARYGDHPFAPPRSAPSTAWPWRSSPCPGVDARSTPRAGRRQTLRQGAARLPPAPVRHPQRRRHPHRRGTQRRGVDRVRVAAGARPRKRVCRGLSGGDAAGPGPVTRPGHPRRAEGHARTHRRRGSAAEHYRRRRRDGVVHYAAPPQ